MTATISRLGAGRRPIREWTQAEIDDMNANYQRLGWREMVRRLGRSKGSVTGKASNLSLTGKWELVYRKTG